MRKKMALRILCALILLLCVPLLLLWIRGGSQAAFSGQPDEPYRTGDTQAGRIAIQCNVAWGTEFLPDILRILEKNNLHITFNILGEWAEKEPDALRAIAAAGHELGNHGYYHVMHSEIDAERCKREIESCSDLVEEITGIRPTIFAPPSGDYNESCTRTAQSLGYRSVLWSIDTIDWRREGKAAILRRVFRDPKAGDFILMHPVKDTVEALPEIISGLLERGLTPCTIGELLPPLS